LEFAEWEKFNLVTKEHFYHLGGVENNRNSMLEALILNYEAPTIANKIVKTQPTLFDYETNINIINY